MLKGHTRISSKQYERLELQQSTERIQYWPKPGLELETYKKADRYEFDFQAILRETGQFQIYDQFCQFNMKIEELINDKEDEEIRRCCFYFMQSLQTIIFKDSQVNQSQSFSNPDSSKQNQLVKQLIQQINVLRQKVERFQQPLNFNSISSLQQNYYTQEKSNTNRYSIKKGTSAAINVDQFTVSQINLTYHQSTNNFIQLKSITFQLLCTIWRYFRKFFPHQSDEIRVLINQCYQFQITNYQIKYDAKLADVFLDKVNSIASILNSILNQEDRLIDR